MTQAIIVEEYRTVCAWCGQHRIDGAWVAAADLPAQAGLRLTHGICPACSDQMFSDAAVEAAVARHTPVAGR